jgi:hypothetical protein
MMTEFKRTQRDYPLSFKIAVVEQVEKGEMTYKRPSSGMAFRGAPPFLSGYVNMAGLTGVLDFLTW